MNYIELTITKDELNSKGITITSSTLPSLSWNMYSISLFRILNLITMSKEEEQMLIPVVVPELASHVLGMFGIKLFR